MGLKSYRKWKLREQILEILGITEEQLVLLPKAIEMLKKPTEAPKTTTSSAPVREPERREVITPEQYVDMFAGDVEEFYPNGRNRN